MRLQTYLYLSPLILAAIISGFFSWYVWQRRKIPGAKPLAILMLALFEWSVAYLLQLISQDLLTQTFWSRITYLGVVTTPVFWLLFAIEFTGRKDWITRWRIIAIMLVPTATLVVIWSKVAFPWFWTFEEIVQVGELIIRRRVGVGFWFWMHSAYSYALLLTGAIMIVRALLQWPSQYRRQMVWILLAMFVPWIANAITIFNPGLFPIDITPFAFAITGVGMALALFQHRFLDIVPIARHILVESMSDGVIVLDTQNRIVDINPAAKRIIGDPEQPLIGEQVDKVLANWPDIVDRFRNVKQADAVELVMGETPQRHFSLQISPLQNRDKEFIGRLTVWHEITQLKKVQSELEILAKMDDLTMVFNRRHFLGVAANELKRAIRHKHPLSLVLIDIDHFKQINDMYGHAAGDQALITFAQICKMNIREIDVFARFGGEEFILLLPETDCQLAYQVTERLRLIIAKTPFGFESGQISITISAGIAALMDDQDTMASLLKRADDALYTAKQSGRNQVVVFPGSERSG